MNRFVEYIDTEGSRTSGKGAFTIIELLVVLAVLALLVTIAIPAMNAMQKSFDSGGAESMISTALATARTLAIKNGHYAGVRFQKAWKPGEDVLKAQQYMIFIFNDEFRKMGNINNGFRAFEGYKPIMLPENTGVMENVSADNQINDNVKLINATSFSIVFSPSGKIVIRNVRVRNKDGRTDGSGTSDDMVFNTLTKITNAANSAGRFLQDDYGSSSTNNFGLDMEDSRTNFIIYDCEKLKKIDQNNRFSGYLQKLKPIYINPYTGELIK